jgi:uncharacterized protein with NRDE domain
MCTLTLISVESAGALPGLRVVMNRDELRHRPAAEAPSWRRLESGVRAVWPTDPVGGGTWIAATSRGLVLCLLNLNLEPPPLLNGGLVSRGLIIPDVVEAGSAVGVVRALEGLDLDRYAPFRLVVAERGGGVWECRWDRARLSSTAHDSLPLCFVSSGLGDSRVAGRLRLFEERVEEGAFTPDAQDTFHVHRWAEAPEVSVLMSRERARTVSITTVEVSGSATEPRVEMRYQPVPEEDEGTAREAGSVAVSRPLR